MISKMKTTQKPKAMKTLSYYKNRYRKAVKAETKAKIMNAAMLNLCYDDQQKFMEFQVKYMNEH